MLFKFLGAVSVTCLLSTNAIAQVQSYNIDLDLLNNVPLSTEGGFALLPGTWNRVTTGTTNQRLIATDGVLDINSDITVSNTQMGTNIPLSIPTLLPAVYEDYLATQGAVDVVGIDDLDAGTYAMVLYSWAPGASTSFEAKVEGVSQGTQTVVSPPVFPGYVRGQSLETFVITVPNQNDDITIEIGGISDTGVLNGIQLYQLLGTGGMTQCFQTVPNSSGGTATISPRAITPQGFLPLNVGVLPGGLPPSIDPNSPGAIVCFASNFQTANADFFCPLNPTLLTGNRCIGGANLARVGTALPGGVGFITPSGTYSLDVDLANLLAQGVDTSPGATLYFQMVYRDNGNPLTCDTAVIRWTNSLVITLP